MALVMKGDGAKPVVGAHVQHRGHHEDDEEDDDLQIALGGEEEHRHNDRGASGKKDNNSSYISRPGDAHPPPGVKEGGRGPHSLNGGRGGEHRIVPVLAGATFHADKGGGGPWRGPERRKGTQGQPGGGPKTRRPTPNCPRSRW